jgi:hypothetical protein
MDLAEKGRTSERWHKGMQARELAVCFGLAEAERIVQQRYPDHIVSVVDTSTVLRAGWARAARNARRAHDPALTTSSRHGNPASRRLTAGMQNGPWNTTPCLMLSTELMGQGGVVVNAL